MLRLLRKIIQGTINRNFEKLFVLNSFAWSMKLLRFRSVPELNLTAEIGLASAHWSSKVYEVLCPGGSVGKHF